MMNAKRAMTSNKTMFLAGAGFAVHSVLAAGTAMASLPAQSDAVNLPAVEHAEKNAADLVQGAREFEASFLKVSQGCKVSHSSFEAVRVGLENVPAEIRAIHAEIENA